MLSIAVISIALASAATTFAAQDKPATTFNRVADCVRAATCTNMTSAKINWYDMVGIPVMTFTDNGWTYAVAYHAARNGRPDEYVIYLTPPNEQRPTQSVSLDSSGTLVRGSLGPLPGERVPSRFPGGLEASLLAHNVYAAAGWYPTGLVVGEEFKPFWQKQADQAVAAAVRVIAR